MLPLRSRTGLSFFILVILICATTLSFGQSGKKDTLHHRIIIDSATYYKIAQRVPNPTSLVNDFEGVLTKEERKKINDGLIQIERETTVEIVVVSLDSTLTGKANFDTTTLVIAKKWRVGKRVKNNGILIGFSKSLRLIRIQNGYGIEKKISDAKTKEIIDTVILPQFRKGNYYLGIKEGINSLYTLVK